MTDLNEASMCELLAELRKPGLSIRPTHLVISEQGLAQARERAASDPEFARMVLAELGIDLLP